MSSTLVSASKSATSAAAQASSATRAKAQGGILEGGNPSHYDSSQPIILFIIQAGIIIIFCRLLHYPLSRLRQPRVIAEVIGGILLGPSVMGRIPGFTAAIFPTPSMPNLNLVANLGLVLFLFLVGLEADMRLIASNWRVALSVGTAGMILPFGLGCAIAWGLYNQFRAEPGTVHIGFGVYMLFVGVAMAITAFPVLCRILTELKLLSTPVGIIVLSAGVGNDVVGWILLALCVALVNAGSGLTALWVFLTCVAWVLFIVFAVRPAFLWLLRRTGSMQNGPSQGIMALTMLMVLTSAWFTGVIGVHPIFGGFLIGLICPHDAGFAITLTEKVEDLVTILFLPLYFALSGLSTNLGLLDSGITWAYVVGVFAVAFFGKIIGGTLAARSAKLVWRESFTIGVLMSCKGLVELIVLNIGLQAKILSVRTFTIFVVMALATTFITTPLTSFLYPPSYQKKLEAWKRGEIDWDGRPLVPTDDDASSEHDVASREKLHGAQVRRLLVYLRLDTLSALVTFVGLLGGSHVGRTIQKVHPRRVHLAQDPKDGQTVTDFSAEPPMRPIEVYGVRMLELTERTSSVMKVSELDDVRDPVLDVFHTFANLNNVTVSGAVDVVPEDLYAETLTRKAHDLRSDLLLIPWGENMTESSDGPWGLDSEHRFAGGSYNHFLAQTLACAHCHIAIVVDNGFGGQRKTEPGGLTRKLSGLSLRGSRDLPTAPVSDRGHHIFFPYFGGADDHVASRFVMQLAQNTNVTATVLYVRRPAGVQMPTTPLPVANPLDAITPPTTTTTTEDVNEEHDQAIFTSLKDSLPRAMEARVTFDVLVSVNPLRDTLERATLEVGRSPGNAGDLVVLGRRKGSKRGLHAELTALLPSLGHPSSLATEVRSTLGDLAELMLVGHANASLMVVQAAKDQNAS